ncbi:dynactin p62 [Coniochaeta ligniaria NRRL 30616]|uniref:Dynactin subunit 4 n=1 Tax=Coniochaeta ligniaria NRRL 30616 TaxID=1408157 RepID=A0A1J7JZA3_9PEZI|nr:dynactin p62 [Coniochaeta ligniaria NRRL 30616]
MAPPPLTPYTFIQCPCSDSSPAGPAPASPSGLGSDAEDDDRTFDPRAPRSNYSLHPLEYLMYCEDCHQIRCPRCVAEEIVTYYCPSCLFEIPSSNLKSEGNRCTRSCFQCPICIGPLAVTSLEAPPDPNLLAADNASAPSGPYILACSYCHWSSTEIGIKFDKPNGIYSQLQKVHNGGHPRVTAKDRKDRRKDTISETTVSSEPSSTPATSGPLDTETHFDNLRSFYTHQISDSVSSGPGLSLTDMGVSSPSSLTRLMNLYTVNSLDPSKKPTAASARRSKPTFREAADAEEGLQPADLDESSAIQALRVASWPGTATAEQRGTQEAVRLSNLAEPPLHGRSRLVSELRPIPVLLRTKRSKRCPVCRHIISKPEPKVASTRFRIRLVAGSYIPAIAIRPLNLSSPSLSSPTAAAANGLLQPLKPVQYLLTFTNPIFDPVKVTLATPATVPGRFASKVTVLCPQFDIDANTDVWDEALRAGEAKKRADERLEGLKEDEDVLEIPMFVRVEWEVEAAAEVGTAIGGKETRERRELAYWCVLGVGRISQD